MHAFDFLQYIPSVLIWYERGQKHNQQYTHFIPAVHTEIEHMGYQNGKKSNFVYQQIIQLGIGECFMVNLILYVGKS